MIDYELYCKIKDYHDRCRLTVTQIARELRLDTRTVARWVAAEKFQPRKAAPRPSKLDSYKNQIVRWLESHPYTAAQIFLRLREGVYRRDHHRQGLRPPDPSAAYAGLPEPLICAGRVRPGGLGPVRHNQRGQHPSAAELLRDGAVYSRMLYVEFTVSETMEHFLPATPTPSTSSAAFRSGSWWTTCARRCCGTPWARLRC
jgi:hypothetical protein